MKLKPADQRRQASILESVFARVVRMGMADWPFETLRDELTFDELVSALREGRVRIEERG